MIKLHIIEHRKAWYGFSLALGVLSIVALTVWGLRPGIDFTGGSLLEVSMNPLPTQSAVHEALATAGHTEAVVQLSQESVLIRTRTITEEEHQVLLGSLTQTFGAITELKFDSIGPIIGKELRQMALWGIGTSLVLIALYLAWSFKSADETLISGKKIAILTVLKTFHDLLISIGVFAILGHFLGYEMDTAFVAGALTILGYSINDGVVVLDRTRENLKLKISTHLEEIVDRAIDQTLARSINTSVTVFLALLAVFLFGGESTRPFAMLLLIGVLVGTYSSVFIASPLLVTLRTQKNT
ncbi:protein translocase subunit SecF [Candidatus Uhrbacteria bacterium]|nr:protein translocase subunit SecF [Candidatus Uhrbacteria bacterium]